MSKSLALLSSFAFSVTAAAVMQAPAAHAQEQQSFKTLVGKGFEIKAVTFARGESTDNRDAVLVTLQKDKAVAVCYFAAVNWINLNNPTLEDGRRCELR